ncbi:MAG: hypothetical protein R3321_03495, partial [Nitrososphaeraceae archaeon]|nr:hypothetical protein [Nitrososphaeraceae archaeon]
MTSASVLLDSVSPLGIRLTSFLITFPRIILCELNTHRMISKSSASSRAIPVKKMINMVMENPYIPGEWGANQKGMKAESILSEKESIKSKKEWLKARDSAVSHAEKLLEIGVHKQLTNRLLEP